MEIPLQVTFRDLPQSPELQQRIRDKVGKLHSLHPRITTCRVTVERRHRHHRHGRPFTVRLDVHVPEHDIVVSFDENEDVQVALRDAFAAAHRQLRGC